MRRIMMYLMWVIMMVFRLTMEWKGSEGCLESERIGLLNINAYLQDYSVHRLPWSLKSDFDDCCDWQGVECNIVTGRVTSLDINEFMYRTIDYYRFGYDTRGSKELRLNASLFIPFQELTSLSLNDINMVGCLENEGFEKLSALVHLEILDLEDNMIDNNILSSLSTLSSLKYLILGGNNFTTQAKGFEEISNLRNLESLNLGYNNLGNNILPYLNGMSSLKTLKLRVASLNGTINIQDLEALRQLEAINLRGNDILLKGLTMFSNLKELIIDAASLCEPQEISWMTRLEEVWLFKFVMSENITLLEELSTISSLKVLKFLDSNIDSKGWPIGLKKLENLTIQDSIIHGDFLYTVGTVMTNLKSLQIGNSSLQSTISPGLCNLQNLHVLDLSHNYLIGELPQCLSNLTSLQSIDISYNGLQGNISESSPLAKLFCLESIVISSNGFRIPLSLSPFFNHSRLQSFYGYENQETYEDHHPWMKHQPRFQLRHFVLSSRHNHGGGFVGRLPRFLYDQSLEQLYIKDTKLEVNTFPWWLMDNNTNLEVLGLVNCSLSLYFQPPNYLHPSHEKLSFLDISHNNIHGTIPPHICTIFPSLVDLSFGDNKLIGSLPAQLSNCSCLEGLDVSNNGLSGEIPMQFWNTSRFLFIDLSRNQLSGSLSSTFISPWIYEVNLSRNRLTALPSREDQGIFSTRDYNLRVLNLSNNRFSGTVPKWIVGFPRLTYLSLNNNGFSGEFVMAFCFERFKMIDVSHNNLSGDLAPAFTSTNSCCYEMLNVEPVLRSGLDFITKTHLYTYRGKPLALMCGMDFSSNKFTGEIPPQIGLKFIYLKLLNLSYNQLEGQIPSSFSNLHHIESLDLSHNNLSGKIPPQLTELTSLSVFDMAYNNLSGKCPKFTAQFGTFNQDSYRGNPFLCCTFPIQTREPLLPQTTSHDDDKGEFIDMEAFYASGGVTCVMTMLTITVLLYINPLWRQVWFYYVKIVVGSSYYFVVDNLPLSAKYKMWELRL